jgi:hypothetical protein
MCTKELGRYKNCQKAAKYVIYLGSSCPMAGCHISRMLHTMGNGPVAILDWPIVVGVFVHKCCIELILNSVDLALLCACCSSLFVYVCVCVCVCVCLYCIYACVSMMNDWWAWGGCSSSRSSNSASDHAPMKKELWERERERKKERKKERNEVGDQPMITVKFCQVSFYTWSNYVVKDIYKNV